MLSEAVVSRPDHAVEEAGRNPVRRALSLDAMRGLAVLGMVLSGLVPFKNNTLPAWMYHAQTPPPTHVYDASIVGMTWVDLVFPLFLFALGAAIPLALGPKVAAGASKVRLVLGALMRGGLLLFFALYVQHLRPNVLTEVYGNWAYGMSIGAFLLMFPVFARLPRRWPGFARFAIRAAGWAGAVALLATLRYPDGSGFTVHRHDIIIVILANVAVSTALVWLWFPFSYSGRLCIMAVVLTCHLARQYSPWGQPVTNLDFLRPVMGDKIFEGLIWACSPTYQKYLLIALPGTIAGDVLATWLRPATQRLSFSIQNSRWRELSLVRCLGLAIVCAALVVGTVVGFSLNDWLTTVGMGVAVSGIGFMLLYSPPARKRLRNAPGLRGQPRVSALLFRALFTWGMIWLVIGLALYPYQGGIRKDPATLSYLFVTAGLGYLVLLVFAVITEAMHRPGPLFLLIDNGQNPMIAYVASAMVIVPLLQLVPVGGGLSLLEWLSVATPTPWTAFGKAVAIMLLAAMLVSVITRLRIYWRT
jgi:predicted acyltransferase